MSQKMKPRRGTETTQRVPPFAFAHDLLSFYADGAKAYWRAFGQLGQPAVQAVETWVGLQRRYLEALEAAFVLPTAAPIEGGHTSPPQPGRPLLLAPSLSWDSTIEY